MSLHKVFNFSAGPAILPESVLLEAQRDLVALPGVADVVGAVTALGAGR